MTRRMPAECAATTFSLMPPTGSTKPRRLISPVMAVSLRTVRSVMSETSAMNIDTPALGPSLGVEPDGMGLDDAERGLRALLHHVAELAGQDEPAAARHAGRLDEQDIAADRRPG